MSRGKCSNENSSNKSELVDLEFERIRKKNEIRRQEIEREAAVLLIEEEPIIADLLSVGIQVESVSDLMKTSEKYEEAIPVLIDQLSKPYDSYIKEAIVRALAVKEAKGIACKAIIEEYKKAPKDTHADCREFSYRWAFGNTMAVIMTDDYVDEVIELVLDVGNGPSRDMFVKSLGKTKSFKAKQVLEKLIYDPEPFVRDEAQKALNKMLKKKNLVK